MDLDTIIGEVKDRGFDYLPNARITRWVNQVYLNLCESERWPFLEADSTGSSPPLTISDLGAVDSVIDATNNRILTWVDRRTLLDADTDLTTTGTPVCWYQESQTVLKVYPANTAITLNVHYFKVPSELSAGGDEPVIPARWQELLIDGTVVRAYKDTDNFDLASSLQQFYDYQLEQMRDTLLRNWGNTDSIYQTYSPDQGGYFF